MIPSQRHLFAIPRDVAYLNCAYMGPLMNSVVSACDDGGADEGDALDPDYPRFLRSCG